MSQPEGAIERPEQFCVESFRCAAALEPRDHWVRVFAGVTGEQVSMAFRRAAKAANIEDFRFHDLRHTAASWLRMQGPDIHTIEQLLGHRDVRMAARYHRLSPSFLSTP